MNRPRLRLWFWWLVFSMLIACIILIALRFGHLSKPVNILTENSPGLYTINHFVDGDTIAVNMNGKVETVRMIGIDTPETHKPNTPVQCYGPEAANYTRQLIGNQKIRLQSDPLDTNRDRYNRLLRYVFLPDGTLIEEKVISSGYGFAYTLFPFEKTERFKAIEASAKNQKLGLWSACQVTVEGGAEHTNPVQLP